MASTIGEACGLETGNCKTREILQFPPFVLRSLTEETRYKSPQIDLFDGPCIVSESGELWLVLVLR